MKGHECYHCKQWVDAGVEHDCWTTTEQALTRDLSEDLRDAWERLRETAVEFGDQRIYASHHSIMFARKACYFFVRPHRKRLEIVFWLTRDVAAPQIKKVIKSSKVKHAHVVHIVHRDQVEAPLTDWLREAYGLEDALRRQKDVKPAGGVKGAAKAAKRMKRRTPKKAPRRSWDQPRDTTTRRRRPRSLR